MKGAIEKINEEVAQLEIIHTLILSTKQKTQKQTGTFFRNNKKMKHIIAIANPKEVLEKQQQQ